MIATTHAGEQQLDAEVAAEQEDQRRGGAEARRTVSAKATIASAAEITSADIA